MDRKVVLARLEANARDHEGFDRRKDSTAIQRLTRV